MNLQKSDIVKIGDHELGGNLSVQVQSMIVSDAMDTDRAVEEIIDLYKAGSPLVRLSIPSLKEARNLKNIKHQLEDQGFDIPLVADIHFTPKAAEVAAEYVEKVRINPGNFADKKRFESKEYSEDDYQNELIRIERSLQPFIEKCKKYDRAVRIGVNHGSLSDRITSYYGDTKEGMVASAMEYLAIFKKADFSNVVVSLKSSNPKVMIDANRLFHRSQVENGWYFPIHLGVTEAGSGEDGRIKSALGIGILLKEGIGDTIRVSLTEDAVNEIPVAKFLANTFGRKIRTKSTSLKKTSHRKCKITIDLRHLESNVEIDFESIGYHLVNGNWLKDPQAADYVLFKGKPPENYPKELTFLQSDPADKKYYKELTLKSIEGDFNMDEKAVLILKAIGEDKLKEYRKIIEFLEQQKINNECILFSTSKDNLDSARLRESVYLGGILVDCLADGICIQNFNLTPGEIVSLSFGIAQASGRRVTKAEFISCPSCGRTQFNLQETTSKIQERTKHLVGLKIGVMGCVVNGPGEMADAHYGYVGSGKKMVSLYKGQELVKRNVSEESAVESLIQLIKENGDWIEP